MALYFAAKQYSLSRKAHELQGVINRQGLIKASDQGSVNAPASTVWSVLIDSANWHQWIPGSQCFESPPNETIRLGHRLQYRSFNDQSENPTTREVEITHWEKERAIGFRFPNGHERIFRLTDEEGQAHVVVTYSGDVQQILQAMLEVDEGIEIKRRRIAQLGMSEIEDIQRVHSERSYHEQAKRLLGNLKSRVATQLRELN